MNSGHRPYNCLSHQVHKFTVYRKVCSKTVQMYTEKTAFADQHNQHPRFCVAVIKISLLKFGILNRMVANLKKEQVVAAGGGFQRKLNAI